MKDGWTTVELLDVCENLDRKRIPITKSKRESGDIPYYGASGVLDYVADFIFDEDLLLVSEDGANLLARTYPIAFSISGKTWVNNHAHVLRFGNIHSQRFIEYYLNSISLEAYVSGMAQPKLNQKKLNSIKVPFPHHHEQKQIVSILDNAFDGIATATANAEKNLQNARELFESYLNSVFTKQGDGRVETSLGEEIDLLTGHAFKSKEYVIPPDGIALLRGDNILQGYFRWDGVKNWPDQKVGEFRKYLLSKDDVVLAMDRTWVKAGLKYAKISDDELPCLLVQRVARLRCNDLLDADYLYFLLGSKPFTDYVLSIQTGIGVPHISGSQIKSFVFQRPTVAMQREIAVKLNSLSGEVKRLESIYRQKFNGLAELKQSLLKMAFAGDLTAGNMTSNEDAVV